jgi:hypothetical protein
LTCLRGERGDEEVEVVERDGELVHEGPRLLDEEQRAVIHQQIQVHALAAAQVEGRREPDGV